VIAILVQVENVALMLKSLIEWRNPAREPGEPQEEEEEEDDERREKVFGASRNRSLQLIVITHVGLPVPIAPPICTNVTGVSGQTPGRPPVPRLPPGVRVRTVEGRGWHFTDQGLQAHRQRGDLGGVRGPLTAAGRLDGYWILVLPLDLLVRGGIKCLVEYLCC
jgi:hypothetical protein